MLTTGIAVPARSDAFGTPIDEMYDRYGVDVDYDLATLWLDEDINKHNRKFKKLRLDRYADDMYNDRWYRNGAAICFGRDGEGNIVMDDGQHRLEALRIAARRREATGRPKLVIRFLVYGELSRNARLVIDNNAPRTYADAGVIGQSIPYAKSVVPIGKRVYNWLEGQNPVPSGNNRLIPSEPVFNEFYLKHVSALNQAAYWGGHLNQRIKTPVISGGFAHYLIHEVSDPHYDETDVDVAQAFFQAVATGAELIEGHPAKALRDTVVNRRATRTLNSEIALALYLRAWNAFAQERLYRAAVLPEGMTVTSGNLALPVPPNPDWTGSVYRSLHQ